MESYKEKLRNMAILVGYLNIVIKLQSFENQKEMYNNVLNKILKWIAYFVKNGNMEDISFDERKKVYDKIDLLREQVLFDKNFNDEKLLSDEILIWYNIVFMNGGV